MDKLKELIDFMWEINPDEENNYEVEAKILELEPYVKTPLDDLKIKLVDKYIDKLTYRGLFNQVEYDDFQEMKRKIKA